MRNNNKNECEKWLRQAKYDLNTAKNNLKNKDYEWSCFLSQQSAEKALKAFLYLNGERLILTHSVNRLIKKCLEYNKDFENIRECKKLDEYYIPTRYPNGLPDNIPHEFYTKEDAEICVNYAEKVIELVERMIQ